jgi:hypothetical protein
VRQVMLTSVRQRGWAQVVKHAADMLVAPVRIVSPLFAIRMI